MTLQMIGDCDVKHMMLQIKKNKCRSRQKCSLYQSSSYQARCDTYIICLEYFLIQCVIMCRYFFGKANKTHIVNKLWGSYGKQEVSSVWCENARTNDGENPEITIPKSEVWISKCEARSLKSEVWRCISLSVDLRCQFLWIVHLALPLQYSLSFFDISTLNVK
jgi:hypothetical protein